MPAEAPFQESYMRSHRIDENLRGVAQAFNGFGVQLLAALTGD
jgi:hypothetical protein